MSSADTRLTEMVACLTVVRGRAGLGQNTAEKVP